MCFADQKNISDSMTWKILMQPIIFCGVANLVEETEMIFFLGKQSNTCYVQELDILWGFLLSYSNPPDKMQKIESFYLMDLIFKPKSKLCNLINYLCTLYYSQMKLFM